MALRQRLCRPGFRNKPDLLRNPVGRDRSETLVLKRQIACFVGLILAEHLNDRDHVLWNTAWTARIDSAHPRLDSVGDPNVPIPHPFASKAPASLVLRLLCDGSTIRAVRTNGL
jgi:hypothetical protein